MTGASPTILSWSSGKDSATALSVLKRDPRYDVQALFTTLNGAADRVAMHAVRRELLRAQAAAAGLPLIEVDLPFPCSDDDYRATCQGTLEEVLAGGIQTMAFGDLFLADVRAFREAQCEDAGLASHFPLWQRDTTALAREMIDSGLQATLTCVDPKVLDPSFAGRPFDAALLDALPEGADSCGENGEFHTFVHRCPAFSQPIGIEVGERIERGGFVYCDVLPR